MKKLKKIFKNGINFFQNNLKKNLKQWHIFFST